MSREAIGKIVIAVLALVVLIGGGQELYAHRHFKETIVKGPGVTRTTTLGEYFDGIKGTINDSNVYFLEGKRPGGTVLVLGGSHPNESSGNLAAILLVENAVMDAGTMIVIPHINRSGSTGTQPSSGYPLYYSVKTDWGEQKFRLGDRITHPLDQWPDPDVFVHYPSGQLLSYVESRNVNRCWPGRPSGMLTEKTTYAAMQLIKKEKVDVVIDLHEAELLYPVTNCIVAPTKDITIATMAAINISSSYFDIHTEPSPPNYHGLTHREIADHSDAYPFLLEASGPFLDQPTGPKTPELILDGKDEFLLVAGKRGLLFTDYDESGKPMKMRVGRHMTTIDGLCTEWSGMNPDREIVVNVPGYEALMQNDVGHYLLDPSKADPDDITYD
ncbi:MAG: succinylglutamate desuccinylase [Bacillota bacterium]